MLAIDWKWIRISESTSLNLVIYCDLARSYKYDWARLLYCSVFVSLYTCWICWFVKREIVCLWMCVFPEPEVRGHGLLYPNVRSRSVHTVPAFSFGPAPFWSGSILARPHFGPTSCSASGRTSKLNLWSNLRSSFPDSILTQTPYFVTAGVGHSITTRLLIFFPD